jgi:hypothetical protein
MAYLGKPDSSLTRQELIALERVYRRDLQDLAAARASYASLRDVTDRDEQEILLALARIEYLLGRKPQWQAAMERREPIEVGVYA